VPAAFVLLGEVPRTPSGKVDRQALPEPGVGAMPQAAFVAPRDTLEESLASVWKLILGVERVGVNDNFFELGGHSLLLIRLHARLGEALGREISMVDLLTYPSVGALARHLSRGSAEEPAWEHARSGAGRQIEAKRRRRDAMRSQQGER
jgi:acyl carrier protein